MVTLLPARVRPTLSEAEIGVSASRNWLAAPETALTMSVSTVPGEVSHIQVEGPTGPGDRLEVAAAILSVGADRGLQRRELTEGDAGVGGDAVDEGRDDAVDDGLLGGIRDGASAVVLTGAGGALADTDVLLELLSVLVGDVEDHQL